MARHGNGTRAAESCIEAVLVRIEGHDSAGPVVEAVGVRERILHPKKQTKSGQSRLVLVICADLNLSGNDALDRLAEAGKRHDARTEKWVDGSSALAVKEVEELHDEI